MLFTIPEEVKKRRKMMNLSQKGLSERAGLPGNAIYRIENNKSCFIYPMRAYAIAEALNCQVLDICNEKQLK